MLLAISNIPSRLKKAKFKYAFICLAISIAALLATVSLEVFPYLLLATNDVRNSITINKPASSQKTMKILLIIAAIGTPLVALTPFLFSGHLSER